MTEESKLEMAERRVREGETNVARQRDVVAQLRRGGYAGGRAERLLAAFEAGLAQRRNELAQLQGTEGSG